MKILISTTVVILGGIYYYGKRRSPNVNGLEFRDCDVRAADNAEPSSFLKMINSFLQLLSKDDFSIIWSSVSNQKWTIINKGDYYHILLNYSGCYGFHQLIYNTERCELRLRMYEDVIRPSDVDRFIINESKTHKGAFSINVYGGTWLIKNTLGFNRDGQVFLKGNDGNAFYFEKTVPVILTEPNVSGLENQYTKCEVRLADETLTHFGSLNTHPDTGIVEMHPKIDNSDLKHEWTFINQGDYYHIKIVGRMEIRGKQTYLGCTEQGYVRMCDKDDGSGRQRWIVNRSKTHEGVILFILLGALRITELPQLLIIIGQY